MTDVNIYNNLHEQLLTIREPLAKLVKENPLHAETLKTVEVFNNQITDLFNVAEVAEHPILASDGGAKKYHIIPSGAHISLDSKVKSLRKTVQGAVYCQCTEPKPTALTKLRTRGNGGTLKTNSAHDYCTCDTTSRK